MHKYIQYLEYAYENSPFSTEQAIEALDLTEEEFNTYLRAAIVRLEEKPGNDTANRNATWEMTQDALLSYLEYIELHEARKSSKQAKCLSIIAITISAILAVASIALTIVQMNSTTTVMLDKASLSELQISPTVKIHQEALDALKPNTTVKLHNDSIEALKAINKTNKKDVK